MMAQQVAGTLATSLVLALLLPAATGDDLMCHPLKLCPYVAAAQLPCNTLAAAVKNNQPWVVCTDTTISGARAVAPGTATLPFPAVFVMGNATLSVVQGAGAPGEVVWTAFTALCDNSTLALENTRLRLNQEVPMQYPWIAYDRSRMVVGAGVSVTAVAAGVASGGQWLTVFGGASSLEAGPVTFPRGFDDAWELGAVESASVHLKDAAIFSETYVSGNASFVVENSSYFDIFFEACPGETLSLPELPTLCQVPAATPGRLPASSAAQPGTGTPMASASLARSRRPGRRPAGAAGLVGRRPQDVPQCMSAQHQAVNFTLGPPHTQFNYKAINSKLFSFAVASHPTSTTSFSTVPEYANLAVGLSELVGDLTVHSVTGPNASLTGLPDRTINLVPGQNWVGSWHFWNGDTPMGITFETFSDVGDVSLGANSTALLLPGTTAQYGSVTVQSNSIAYLVYTTIFDRLYVRPNGTLVAIWTTLEGSAELSALDASVFYIHSFEQDSPPKQLLGSSLLYTTTLSSPANASTVKVNTPVALVGTMGVAGSVASFPPGHTAVRPCGSTQAPVPLQVITASVTNGSVGAWTPTQPGCFKLTLRFDSAPAYAEDTLVLFVAA